MFWKLALKPGTGLRAERYALGYLRSQGLRLKQRNYACRLGEIDLIMMDGQYMVFIEVRFRKNSRYGSAEETLHVQKRQKIIAAAQHYLQSNPFCRAMACRFDVVAVTPDVKGKWQTNWIRNAFDT